MIQNVLPACPVYYAGLYAHTPFRKVMPRVMVIVSGFFCYLLLVCTDITEIAICSVSYRGLDNGKHSFCSLLPFICLLTLTFGFCPALGYSGRNSLFLLLGWGQEVV